MVAVLSSAAGHLDREVLGRLAAGAGAAEGACLYSAGGIAQQNVWQVRASSMSKGKSCVWYYALSLQPTDDGILVHAADLFLLKSGQVLVSNWTCL